MGCTASVLQVRMAHAAELIGREYSSAISRLRVVSSMSTDAPVAVRNLKVCQQEFKDLKEFYTVGKVLGKGQFGTCRLVTCKTTGQRYACKSISKRRLGSMSDVLDVRREVQVMHHLAGHPNIVTLKDVYEDSAFVHLVEELCTGGELFDSIIQRGHYSERDAAAAFRCIASVVAHCHNMGVMHRDIKPENFLLSSPGPEATIKATDFGLSLFFSEGQTFKQVVGSAFYVAPEVLRKKYDKRADIWSLGVLLYILLSGVPPFYAETERDIFQAILTRTVSFEGDIWQSVSESAKDVILKMLERNPALRATAAEVLEHDWVREDGTAEAAPLNNEVLHRLQTFAALNKLQQEALKVIATHLPEPEITGLRALFMEMDSDGSGSITVEELRKALNRKGTCIPSRELERIMAQADISGDGTLDYEEFLAATMNLAKLERQEHLYMAFKFFDADGSGFITREDLSQALSKTCTPAEIDGLLAQADSSGDGRIDYTEFCDLMRVGNNALPKAARTVKQGLMRSPASQLDLSRLRVESLSALDVYGPTVTAVLIPPTELQRQQQQQPQQQQPPSTPPQRQAPSPASASMKSPSSSASSSSSPASPATASKRATSSYLAVQTPSQPPPPPSSSSSSSQRLLSVQKTSSQQKRMSAEGSSGGVGGSGGSRSSRSGGGGGVPMAASGRWSVAGLPPIATPTPRRLHPSLTTHNAGTAAGASAASATEAVRGRSMHVPSPLTPSSPAPAPTPLTGPHGLSLKRPPSPSSPLSPVSPLTPMSPTSPLPLLLSTAGEEGGGLVSALHAVSFSAATGS